MDPRFASAIFWVAAACCLVAQVAIIRSAVRAPLVRPVDEGVPRPKRPVEVVWTVVPAIGLAILLYFTWHAVQASSATHRPIATKATVDAWIDVA